MLLLLVGLDRANVLDDFRLLLLSLLLLILKGFLKPSHGLGEFIPGTPRSAVLTVFRLLLLLFPRRLAELKLLLLLLLRLELAPLVEGGLLL